MRVNTWKAGILMLLWGCSLQQESPEVSSLPAASAGMAKSLIIEATAPGEWPQWRGPQRNGMSLESDLLTKWSPEGPPVLWKVKGGEGFSSLAISEGRVFTMVDRDDVEFVLGLDAETGKELWKVESARSFKESQGGNGPRSTPTLDGDRVYTLGATGILLCLNNRTGEILWKRNILDDFDTENLYWGVSTSPLVEKDMLLVNVGGAGTSVVAFNKYSGDVIWKKHTDVASYSSPISITVEGVREIVFFCGRSIVGLSPVDGQLHWRQEWTTLSDMNIATPIFSDPLLFISSGRGTGSGVFRLRRLGESVRAEVQWTSKIMRNHFNGCVLVGEHVYGFDNAILKCIRLEDGEVMWADRSVGKGSLISASGHLFILEEHGDIGVVEATPEEYREKGRMNILDYKSWTPPAIAGGRLYVRDQKNIACLDLRGS